MTNIIFTILLITPWFLVILISIKIVKKISKRNKEKTTFAYGLDGEWYETKGQDLVDISIDDLNKQLKDANYKVGKWNGFYVIYDLLKEKDQQQIAFLVELNEVLIFIVRRLDLVRKTK